jgi:hypothetical protein
VDIWVRLIKEQKIIKDFIYKKGKPGCFENDLREICGKLDIPTPLILQKHLHHLKNFNQVKFTKEEFVESINFDELTLEYVKE